jgi:starch synthase
MKILLAHPGTQHSPHLAQALYQRNCLMTYSTSLSFGYGSQLTPFLPARLVQRRQLGTIPAKLISTQPGLQVIDLLLRTGINKRTVFALRNKLFQKGVDSGLIKNADAIIGFDTSSLILAQRARQMGTAFFLEFTTPHPAEKANIVKRLRSLYPGWSSPEIELGPYAEDQEALAASHILAPSRFVADSLVAHGIAREKITLNPYGVDVEHFPLKSFDSRTKLRFLFLGSFTANKGVPLLLEAWSEVNHEKAELVLAGYGSVPSSVSIPKGVVLMGRVDHEERLKLFHSCDVFLCPSFYEGIALVQIEAMCCGLPVIGTLASGLTDIMTEGREGFVVRPGSVQQLLEKIQFFVYHRDRVESMGRQAHSRATELSWQAYADRWIDIIGKHKTINS